MASNAASKAGGVKRKRNFFDDEELSDVIIKFGDQQVFAHKIMLVNGSLWFEKALLGRFSVSALFNETSESSNSSIYQEAKKHVVELHDDVVPDAMMAMFKNLYGLSCETQIEPCEKKDLAGFHHQVYLMGDKYDIESLRAQAAKKFKSHLSSEFGQEICDDSIYTIQKILGPAAAQFADRTLEIQTKNQVLAHTCTLFYKDIFRNLVAEGKMLAPETAITFLETMSENPAWDDDCDGEDCGCEE